MRERVLGPIKGYYVAVTGIVMGAMADAYCGWGKIFDRPPESFMDTGEVDSLICEAKSSSIEEALDHAEDQILARIDQLPPRAAQAADGAKLSSLAYASRAQGHLTATQITELLVKARARNIEYGITGMLLYFDETFMQYIEGPSPHLELIYRIIRKDPLHSGLILLMKSDIATRAFGSWAMAYDSPGSASMFAVEKRPQLDVLAHAPAVHSMLAMFRARHSVRDDLLRPRQR